MTIDKPLLEKLIEAASEVRKNAYAPYSGFKIGSALLTKSGKIYTGANIENIAYAFNTHAEQNAMSQALCAGEREFAAILNFSHEKEPSPPCGACLQCLSEFCESNFKIIMVNLEGKKKVHSLKDFLPISFKFKKGDLRRSKAK